MATVKRGNPKAFETLNARLKELSGYQAKVGWFESSKYEDGTPVAYVASINELGKNARPFMRPTAIAEEKSWREIAKHGSGEILAGRSNCRDVMDLIGIKAEGDIRKTIANVQTPPLSPITLVARKYRREGKKVTGKTIGEIAALIKAGKMPDVSGVSTKPLVDERIMINTLTHIVEPAE